MNTNTMELNLNEMEMIAGGDIWDHVNGAIRGALGGAVVGFIGGLATAGPAGGVVGFGGGFVAGGVAGGIVGDKVIESGFRRVFPR